MTDREEWKRLAEYAHAATKAITELTPGGGSECFGPRIGEMYTADLPYCVNTIRERDAKAHERWLAAERRAKEALARAEKAEGENVSNELRNAAIAATIAEIDQSHRKAIRTAVEQEIGQYILSLVEMERPRTINGTMLVTAFKRLATAIASGDYRKPAQGDAG